VRAMRVWQGGDALLLLLVCLHLGGRAGSWQVLAGSTKVVLRAVSRFSSRHCGGKMGWTSGLSKLCDEIGVESGESFQ
jgi:hypothetical protein